MNRYRVPKSVVRVEHEVSRSRFIATLGNAETVTEARAFIAERRAEFPDANHHVYAFRVGYGASINEGLSDDGEPSGTSGPPVMAVLRGQEVGDIVLVVTRYFGGIKLGTGGLVRAYGDSARAAVAAMTTREKIRLSHLGISLSYSLYERFKLIAAAHQAEIEGEEFAADVTAYVVLPVDQVEPFSAALRELSAGKIVPILLED